VLVTTHDAETGTMLTYDDAEAPAIEAVAEHTVDCGRGSPAAAPSRGDQMTTTRAGNGSVEPAMRLDELVAVAASIEARRHPGRVMGALQGPTGQRAVLGVGHEWLPDGPVPTSDTLFEIESITRVFTGLLLAIAVVRNEVTLDTPVNALLPGRDAVPSRDGVQITLEHLATHRSGLPPSPVGLLTEGRAVLVQGTNPYQEWTPEGVLEALAATRLRRAPGSGRIVYSNLGAGLLGLALVAAAGAGSYGELVRSTAAVQVWNLRRIHP